jgi:hypothetical protein
MRSSPRRNFNPLFFPAKASDAQRPTLRVRRTVRRERGAQDAHACAANREADRIRGMARARADMHRNGHEADARAASAPRRRSKKNLCEDRAADARMASAGFADAILIADSRSIAIRRRSAIFALKCRDGFSAAR